MLNITETILFQLVSGINFNLITNQMCSGCVTSSVKPFFIYPGLLDALILFLSYPGLSDCCAFLTSYLLFKGFGIII